jgi:YegS/Rv2252/BmrU family lipid kinase
MSRYGLLIVNARARRAAEGIDAAAKILESQGFTLKRVQIGGADSIGAAIRRHRDSVDCVIIGGGDGSLNAAAESLAETGLPLGVLPLGTANDFARTLQIPLDVPGACAVICDGRLHKVDLGRVNGRFFLNAASFGLSTWVARHVQPQMKRRWGVLAYGFALLDALRASRPFAAVAVCDGQTVKLRTIQVTVGNGVHYGGGLTVAEDAAIDDGWLDLLSLAPLGPWRLTRLALAFRSGRLRNEPSVLVRRARRIEVHTRRPRPINTDGELTTMTPAVFEVAPAALTVFTPTPYLARRGVAPR